MDPEGPIVFFDCLCPLCDGAVRALLRLDRRGRLRFAPLQGETAARLLPEGLRAPLGTVVLREGDGRLRTRSDAALRALMAAGGIGAWARPLLALPRPWRDAAYEWVSRHRDRWFGRRESCRAPGPREAGRFLP